MVELDMDKSCRQDALQQPLFAAPPDCLPTFLIDTSTLIYLDKIDLIDLVAAVFSPLTISQVVAEFGCRPQGIQLCTAGPGETDLLLVQTAVDLKAGLFSEDRQILRAARRNNMYYYNCLMLVLALYCRDTISKKQCEQYIVKLQVFARYSKKVWAYGWELFGCLAGDSPRTVGVNWYAQGAIFAK